jgi:hypothetical protein
LDFPEGLYGGGDLRFCSEMGNAEADGALPYRAQGFVHTRGAVGAGAGADFEFFPQKVAYGGRVLVFEIEGQDSDTVARIRVSVQADAGDGTDAILKLLHEGQLPAADGVYAGFIYVA